MKKYFALYAAYSNDWSVADYLASGTEAMKDLDVTVVHCTDIEANRELTEMGAEVLDQYDIRYQRASEQELFYCDECGEHTDTADECEHCGSDRLEPVQDLEDALNNHVVSVCHEITQEEFEELRK